jgi:hypothetical protein
MVEVCKYPSQGLNTFFMELFPGKQRFIRQTSASNIFHAKTRRREEREAEEQRQGAGNRGFLVLRLLRLPLLATQLSGNAFDLLPLLRILA